MIYACGRQGGGRHDAVRRHSCLLAKFSVMTKTNMHVSVILHSNMWTYKFSTSLQDHNKTN